MRSASPGLIIAFVLMPLIARSCASHSTSQPNGTDLSPSVVVATDKPHYAQGDTVTLTVTNNLDVPVWYIGYPQRDLVFWTLERRQDNTWQRLDFRMPLVESGTEVCRLILYEQPIGDVTELKPHSILPYEWQQRICLFKDLTTPTQPAMIERGNYRFSFTYSLDTVKTPDVTTQPWKRPIDLGETKVVYSNEFFLE